MTQPYISKIHLSQSNIFCLRFAHLAGAVEYTNCFSAEWQDPPPNEYPGYDTKQSDSEVPGMLELWGMQRTPSLPLLPGPLRPGMVAPDRTLPIG